MLKLCVVVPSYYPATVYGGPIFSVHETNKQLALQGVQVRVSTTNANGDTRLDVEPNVFRPFAENYWVKYYHDTVIGRFSWRFVRSVWRDIRQADLVRIEDIFSTYIPPSLLAARLWRKPMLISPRGVLSDWSLASKRPWAKKLWSALLIKPFLRGSWWHATSPEEGQEILRYWRAAKVVVIPNGIDDDAFAAPALSRPDYLRRHTGSTAAAGPVIVSMARLHRKKGFEILIDAFARILDRHPDAVLLIAGKDDGERPALERRIADAALRAKVFLVGELTGAQKAAFLAGADLFVLPSHSENFGNVYLEAMAGGVPVVASKATPWAAVEPAGCGRWVENTVPATAAAMLELLAGDREGLRERARRFAAGYSWRSVAEEFRRVFARMTGEGGRV